MFKLNLNEDIILLDNNNRIIIKRSDDNLTYDMVHERLVNNKYIKVNKWSINNYYDKSINDISCIKDLHIIQIQNGYGNFNAWYDYINDKFIVKQGIWDEISFGKLNEYIREYNGAIASFTIKSDYEDNDIYTYYNNINDQKNIGTFQVTDGIYYAIINLDGTIRGNKLFKGQSIYSVREIINLNEYHNLSNFISIRKKVCNQIKNDRKKAYYDLIKSRNNNNYSPYLDEDFKILLKQK